MLETGGSALLSPSSPSLPEVRDTTVTCKRTKTHKHNRWQLILIFSSLVFGSVLDPFFKSWIALVTDLARLSSVAVGAAVERGGSRGRSSLQSAVAVWDGCFAGGTAVLRQLKRKRLDLQAFERRDGGEEAGSAGDGAGLKKGVGDSAAARVGGATGSVGGRRRCCTRKRRRRWKKKKPEGKGGAVFVFFGGEGGSFG